MQGKYVIALIIVIITIISIVVTVVIIKNKQLSSQECSQQLYAMRPLLFNQYYCLNNRINDTTTKIADAKSKVEMYKSNIANNSSSLGPSNVARLQSAIICQENYITHLTRMLNIYKTTSTDSIKQSVIEECGGYPAADGAVYANNGGTVPSCDKILLPGMVAEDLSPSIECPLFT